MAEAVVQQVQVRSPGTQDPLQRESRTNLAEFQQEKLLCSAVASSPAVQDPRAVVVDPGKQLQVQCRAQRSRGRQQAGRWWNPTQAGVFQAGKEVAVGKTRGTAPGGVCGRQEKEELRQKRRQVKCCRYRHSEAERGRQCEAGAEESGTQRRRRKCRQQHRQSRPSACVCRQARTQSIAML